MFQQNITARRTFWAQRIILALANVDTGDMLIINIDIIIVLPGIENRLNRRNICRQILNP